VRGVDAQCQDQGELSISAVALVLADPDGGSRKQRRGSVQGADAVAQMVEPLAISLARVLALPSTATTSGAAVADPSSAFTRRELPLGIIAIR